MTSTFMNNLLSKTSNMISNINSHSFRHFYYIVTILITINVLINTQNKHITKTHINSNETQSSKFYITSTKTLMYYNTGSYILFD